MTTYNWDFYQVPHTGVVQTELIGRARDATGTQIVREFGMRISNFGSHITTIRSTDDYTKTQLGFKDKGELENPKVTYGFGRNNDPMANHNPFVWGSTVKRINDDEMHKMGMDSRNLRGPVLPAMDVSDTKEVQASGMTAPKKYPTEGWHSFGGKYDGYAAYNGVLN